jgi:hypothetical protein
MTQQGCLGVDGHGLAPHWRLTEVGYMNDPPTQDFLKWDGAKFRRRNRPSRRPEKQNPDTEMLITPIRKC